MNILIIGYGKMGKTIEKIARTRGHSIPYKVDNKQELSQVDPAQVDVAIEFTHPGAAFENIKFCLTNHIKVVSGTTGWLHCFDEVLTLCRTLGGTFFYAANFSLGANIFFKINKLLAKIMNSYPEYNVQIEEIHHIQKKDMPSGTAVMLAEDLIDSLERKRSWSSEKTDNPLTLNISSQRIDQAPGTHMVTYHSAIDSIDIKHTAHNREGFGLGALLVAEWLLDKKGVLGMDDFLNP